MFLIRLFSVNISQYSIQVLVLCWLTEHIRYGMIVHHQLHNIHIYIYNYMCMCNQVSIMNRIPLFFSKPTMAIPASISHILHYGVALLYSNMSMEQIVIQDSSWLSHLLECPCKEVFPANHAWLLQIGLIIISVRFPAISRWISYDFPAFFYLHLIYCT